MNYEAPNSNIEKTLLTMIINNNFFMLSCGYTGYFLEIYDAIKALQTVVKSDIQYLKDMRPAPSIGVGP